MGLISKLGTLILLFLILHTSNFWIPNRQHQILHGEELPLYNSGLNPQKIYTAYKGYRQNLFGSDLHFVCPDADIHLFQLDQLI